MLANLFTAKLNLSTLLIGAVAALVGGAVYPLYMRARLAAGFRSGLGPNDVRMGAFAMSLAIFFVLLPLAKSWGIGLSFVGLVGALVLAWVGRNRGLPILLIVGAMALVFVVALIRPAVLN